MNYREGMKRTPTENMIYRVILKVGYNVAWFDFDSMEDAGEFAKTALIHQSPNDDTRKEASISIKVMDPSAEAEEEEED